MSANHENRQPNALIHEKSPYLLQHAHNPVNWLPWSEEAFARAKAENKPIFLSIGYSTCHWCHVMERESFEDEEVAAALNQNYIAIKVDREERPDIDHIYMTVCQEVTGQGGWPLTIVMTPDKKPFYAGTYFPKRAKWGRPGVMDVLTKLHDFWTSSRDDVLLMGDKVTEAVKPLFLSHSKGEDLTVDTLTQAYSDYHSLFDHTYGGIGAAPKFPTPHQYLFLLREYARTGEAKALHIVEHTLKSMHAGGIYDHIGYGFSRYSVDERWLVPHFEKMLYDNALLAYTYLETHQATQDPFYARVAKEIFHYTERVMTSPEGGFYCAEDADSEGEEGRFYVWSHEEIHQLLDEDTADLFCEVYDVTVSGNFEGHNILNLINRDLTKLAAEYGMTADELDARLEPARQKLFEVREERVHPHKDDKILTSWNGLMIAALAKGAAVLQDTHYLHLAQRASEMIDEKLVNEHGRLLARYRDGESNFLAYLDDYAFYAWGLHELYMASGDTRYLERAQQLIDDAISLFWDEENGGFFFYGSDAEQLIARPKEIYDSAIPSGNSVMAYNLIRHSRLTGSERFAEYGDKQLQAFSASVDQHPSAHAFLLLALQLQLGKSMEIVVTEGDNVDAFGEMVRHVQQAHLPFAVHIFKGKDNQDEINRLAPAHTDKTAVNGQSAVYICENFACQQPLTSLSDVQERL